MENMFVWLLIIAGAAIALLGIFLVASERELKRKRLEIDRLAAKIDASPTEFIPAALIGEQAIDSEASSELRATNEELQKEVATLSAKLALGQKAIMELEGSAQRDQDSHAELQHSCKANEALISEGIDLKARLQTSDGRAPEAMTHQADAQRQRELQSEIVDLQDRLEESRREFRRLESAQQNLPNFESLAANHADERRQREAKIAELEQEVDNARQARVEANSLQATLAESERQRQVLNEETRRYEEEIRHWQERSAEGDENRRRLSALRAPFDALLAKQTELAVHRNQFEEDLAALGGLITMRPSSLSENQGSHSQTDAVTATRSDSTLATVHPTMNTAIHDDDTGEEEVLAASMPVQQLAVADAPAKKSKRHFGVSSLVLIVPMAAALAYGMLNSASEKTEISAPKPVVTSTAPAGRPSNTSAAVNPPRIDKAEAPVLTASIPTQLIPAKKETTPTEKPLPAAKPDARTNGIYEVMQTSRVYAAPSELSPLLGDVEPGVKVNVVNARDGWLEIQSKHGRPPGFIRKEVVRAVRN